MILLPPLTSKFFQSKNLRRRPLMILVFAILLALFAGCPVIPTRPTERFPLLEIQVNNTSETIDDYITWAPTYCRIRIINHNQFSSAIDVTLSNMNPASSGGKLLFDTVVSQSHPTTTATQTTLNISLPADGSWADFVIAGQFNFPSLRDKDAVIQVRENRPDLKGITLGRKALMVRVRKNANKLTQEERDRFINALAILNMTFDNYEVYQEIHSIAFGQAHGGPAFLAWHRIYILRLERELQAIDPSVALHYWRFDEAAPNVFHNDFMGGPPISGFADFSSSNPLATWTIGVLSNILRSPNFTPAASPTTLGFLISEAATLNLGGTGNLYANFRSMEGNPHNPAHSTAFGSGWIRSLSTAVRDPIFFLLHGNVDRLWAKWQWAYNRYDPSLVASYSPQGAYSPGNIRMGHYLEDTMWPWNGLTGDPGTPTDPNDNRPLAAPGGPFPLTVSRFLSPPPMPRPFDTLHYESTTLNPSGLGFAYDDVPFK